MDGLAAWTSSAAGMLDVDAGQVDAATILDLARDVRRAVAGPAAIVAVYLLGVAAARGMSEREAAARLADLAAQWPATTCDWRD